MKKIISRTTKIFGRGIYNVIEDVSIDEGAATESMNFLTLPDKIELINGRRLLGAEEPGNEGVLGMGEIENSDGTKLLLRKIGTSLQYFALDTQTWEDIKTDLLADEPLSFANSFTPAGRQVWMCGQDGLFKLYPSTPTSILDMTSSTKNFKGKIAINKSRMICWGMEEDPTGLRLSKIDKDANYTVISSESVGSGTEKDYTGTLAHGECFGAVFTKGSQILTDDKNGNLTGDGSGTIDYATGDFVLNYTTSNADAVTASYIYEDSLNGGLADFTYSATRLAGEGNVLRQDSLGSKTQSVSVFNNTFYSLQDEGSWSLKVSTDDLTFDNQVYRSKIACPSYKGSVGTAEGIVFVDTFNTDYPKLRMLALNQFGDLVIPIDLSKNFKMSDYTFDEDTSLYKKKDSVIISCKKDSTVNNTLIICNLKQKSFDVVGYTANFFVDLDNKIIAGDSTSPNAYELFTGIDDLDYNIVAYWIGKRTSLRIEDLKKFKKFYVGGYIQSDQAFEVWASFDNDAYEYVGEVEGDGSYVDSSSSVTVGSEMFGTQMVGGESDIVANYFLREIRIRTPKFLTVKFKFKPKGIGYLSINTFTAADIKLRGSKLPRKYRRKGEEGIGFDKVGTSLIIK